MPEISLFYGIRVTMYYDDHNPPHFHAEYNGNKALIEIDGARVIKGALCWGIVLSCLELV